MTIPSLSRSISHSAKSASSREAGLDVAKLLAALAVIWIHACRSNDLADTTRLARFAVPFFAAAAAYSLVRSIAKRQPAFIPFALQKSFRLYLPFLIWSGFYLLFKIGKRSLLPEQECDLPGWNFWWMGGAYHLWFIPFLLASSIVLFPILICVQRRSNRYPLAAIASAIVGLVVALWIPMNEVSGTFGILVGQAMPGLLWGCSLGWCSLIEPTKRTGHAMTWTASVSFLACLVCLGCFARETLLENAAGCGLLLIAMNRRAFNIPSWLSCAGQLSFGIYFAHLMILKVGESLASKLQFEVSAMLDVALFVSTAALAAAIAFALSRHERTRWLVT